MDPQLRPRLDTFSKVLLLWMVVMVIGVLSIYNIMDPEGAAQKRKAEAKAQAVQDEIDRKRAERANEILDAKTAADMKLKLLLNDAESARYENVAVTRIDGGNLMVCGLVNAKNALGAYTGFKRFIVSPNPYAPDLIEGQNGISTAAFNRAYEKACIRVVQRF